MLPPKINRAKSLDALDPTIATLKLRYDQNTGQSGVEKYKKGLWWLKNGSILTYLLATTLGIAVMTALRFIFMPYRPEVLSQFLRIDAKINQHVVGLIASY